MDGATMNRDESALKSGPAAQDPGAAALPMAAGDLHRLIALHERAPDPALLGRLRAAPLRELFAVTPDRDDALQAMALVDEVLGDLPDPIDRDSLAGMIADFDAIHRQDLYRTCPQERSWVPGDPLPGLLRWHEAAGLTAGGPADDPAGGPAPDHLVSELRLLATLLDRQDARAAVRFLDEHVLSWVPAFCGRVATRCRDPFYAGVAILTSAWIDHLRDWLGESCGQPRPAEPPDPDHRRRRWSDGRRPRACCCEAEPPR